MGRSVFVGDDVGAWAFPNNAMPHSNVVIWRNLLLIALSLVLKTDFYGAEYTPKNDAIASNTPRIMSKA
jgi:hypothetical protein